MTLPHFLFGRPAISDKKLNASRFPNQRPCRASHRQEESSQCALYSFASTRGEEREWSVVRRMSACRRKWSEDIVVAGIGKTGPVGAGLRGGFWGSLALQSF